MERCLWEEPHDPAFESRQSSESCPLPPHQTLAHPTAEGNGNGEVAMGFVFQNDSVTWKTSLATGQNRTAFIDCERGRREKNH